MAGPGRGPVTVRRLVGAAALGLLSVLPQAGAAQSLGVLDTGVVQSPILVIEFERVFTQSAFGLRVVQEIEAQGAVIAAENRQIETELIEEERHLTDQRAAMAPEAFRALADDFDTKVQRLRKEQDSKARALNQRTDAARRQFIAASQPVLGSLMREAGAAVILERRAVFLAADAIDVTDQAIALINDAIGDGADLPAPPAAPDTPDAPDQE